MSIRIPVRPYTEHTPDKSPLVQASSEREEGVRLDGPQESGLEYSDQLGPWKPHHGLVRHGFLAIY